MTDFSYKLTASKGGFGPAIACLNTDDLGGRAMSKQPLALNGDAVQPVPRNHGHPTDEHAISWLEGIQRQLAAVRVKRKLPQTRAEHASLAEREARYVDYINRAGWAS